MTRLRRLALERLMRYYRFVSRPVAGKSAQTITSARIAEATDVDPTQVRKDLGVVGLQEMGHVGYDVCEACRAIRVALGFEQPYQAVLIGTGHLGGALLAYSGFERYGLHIVAAFDQDRRKIGRKIAGRTVRSTRGMVPYVRRHKIRLGVLTTPAEVSQKLADRLISAGVEAIWNFTPTRLTAPPGVLVRNEHIAIGLSQIAYHLKQ